MKAPLLFIYIDIVRNESSITALSDMPAKEFY